MVITERINEEELFPYYILVGMFPANDDEADESNVYIIDEKQVVGSERHVRNFIEEYAKKKLPNLEFEWDPKNDESYDSKPLDGQVVHIDYERYYNPNLPIHAICLKDKFLKE